MNGATAEPCVNTTSSPSSASITTMGPSHQALRTRMKAQSSASSPSFSRDSSNAIRDASIQLVQTAPVYILAQRGLVLLVQQVVPHREVVHVGAHEAQVGVVGRADDRLPAHVERRVDHDGDAGELLELGNDVVVQRAVLAPHGLQARRVV